MRYSNSLLADSPSCVRHRVSLEQTPYRLFAFPSTMLMYSEMLGVISILGLFGIARSIYTSHFRYSCGRPGEKSNNNIHYKVLHSLSSVSGPEN